MAGNDDHIKLLRLFDLSQAETKHSGFTLKPEEKEHIRRCAECQHVLEVFTRQFSNPQTPRHKPDDAA